VIFLMRLRISMFCLLLMLASLAPGQNVAGPPITTQEIFIPVTSVNLAPATQASVALVGNPGPQKIYYWMVSNFLLGSSSPVGPFLAANGPNVLTSGNYIAITPVFPAGGIVSIDVLKTLTPTPPSGACNCAVSTGVTSGAVVNDQSNSTSSYTINPVAIGNYTLSLTNEVQGGGSTHLILRQNTVFVCDLSTGCGVGGITGATANGGLLQTGSTLGLITCSTSQTIAFNGTAWACSSAGTGTVTGTGTNNTISKWTGPGSLGNSGITDNGGTIATTENVIMTGTGVLSVATQSPLCNAGSYVTATPGCQSIVTSTNIPVAASGLAVGVVGVINPTVNLSSTPQLAGVLGLTVLQGNGSPASLAGVVGVSQSQGSTGTIAISSGVYGLGTVGQPGGISQNATILEGVGGQASVSHAGQTNPVAIGLHAYSPILTGAATNVYGILVDDQTGGGANNPNPHAIQTIGTAPVLFGGALTVSGAGTFGGALTTNITGGGIQCLQASNAGVVSGSGSACPGSFSFTVNGGSAIASPVNLQNGTNTTVTNPTGSNVQVNVATATTLVAGIVKLANDLGGTALLPTVVGFDGTPICSGYNPTNGQFLQFSTGLSPNPCISSGVSPFSISSGTVNGDAYYTASTTIGSNVPPALRGVYQETWNLSSDASAPPAAVQVGFGGRSITGATTTDTIAYSDITTEIDHDQTASGSVVETIPVPTTSVAAGGLGNAAFAFKYCNNSAQTDTLSPTTFTIQAGTTPAAATLLVQPAICYTVKVDPNNPTTNWLAHETGLSTASPFAADTGAANALVIAIPAWANFPAAIKTGLCFTFTAANAVTGAATIAVTPAGGTSYGAIALDKRSASGVVTMGGSGDIVAGGIYSTCYDGTEWVVEAVSATVTSAGAFSATHAMIEANGTGTQVKSSPNMLLDSTDSFFKTYGGILTTGTGNPAFRSSPAAITIGSGTSIGSTSLCTAAVCPSGMYFVNVYLDVTTACTTTGTYSVNLLVTDDQGAKTIIVPLIGTGATLTVAGAAVVDTVALSSTANFGAATVPVFSTGATTINYSTTAGACGTGGPMVGKLHIGVSTGN
jgi:hypothetical protein